MVYLVYYHYVRCALCHRLVVHAVKQGLLFRHYDGLFYKLGLLWQLPRNQLQTQHADGQSRTDVMSSRLLLVVQYSAVLLAAYYRHVDKLVIKAFPMTISTNLVAAFSFLSIYYLDSSGKSSYGSPGWYVNLAPLYQCNANGAEVCHQHRGRDCIAYHILFVSFNGL
jgi:hypothetical protein